LALSDLPKFIGDNYEVYEWRHATAILAADFPDEWEDIKQILTAFRLYRSHIDVGGGSKSQVAGWIDREFENRGWVERKFKTQITVDETTTESPTHKVDCFKNRVALEIEWNNKDPFFDRDLNNFRLLFDLRVISVGVIITRSDELQDLFDELKRGDSYGNSTTHMGKLLPRVYGGGGGGCPLLVFGIKKSLYLAETGPVVPKKPKKPKPPKKPRAARDPSKAKPTRKAKPKSEQAPLVLQVEKA
jgi:hypothetical protein